jgi:hypothetical protein
MTTTDFAGHRLAHDFGRTPSSDFSPSDEPYLGALVHGCDMRRNGVFDIVLYALQRTECRRAQASMRLRTAQPMATSVCWAAKKRARRRRPISA